MSSILAKLNSIRILALYSSILPSAPLPGGILAWDFELCYMRSTCSKFYPYHGPTELLSSVAKSRVFCAELCATVRWLLHFILSY